MTDERDPKVSAAYRELGAEEPPHELDDAILAAARRGAGARPGFPGRAGPQRWYAPLAAAAVLVLAVAVTLHMQIEQPDIADPAPAATQPEAPPDPVLSAAQLKLKLRLEQQLKSAAKERVGVVNEVVKESAKPMIPKTADLSRASEPEPFPAERAAAVPHVPAAPQAAPPAPAPAPSAVLSPRADEARGSASGVAGTVARQAKERTSRDAAAQTNAPAQTPERELERIAELRGQGRHDEADRALAEFRKRYPDFRIPEAMRERVERR